MWKLFFSIAFTINIEWLEAEKHCEKNVYFLSVRLGEFTGTEEQHGMPFTLLRNNTVPAKFWSNYCHLMVNSEKKYNNLTLLIYFKKLWFHRVQRTWCVICKYFGSILTKIFVEIRLMGESNDHAFRIHALNVRFE